MGASGVRALVASGAVGPLLAACGSSLPACSNTVSIDVRSLAPLHAGAGGTAQVCLGQAPSCLTLPVSGKEQILVFPVPDGMVPGPGVPAQGPVPVAFTVRRDDVAIVSLSSNATLSGASASTGPACITVSLVATPTALRQVEASQLPSTTPVVLLSPSSTPGQRVILVFCRLPMPGNLHWSKITRV